MKVSLSTLATHLTLSQLAVGEVYGRHPADVAANGDSAYMATNNYDYPLVNLSTGSLVARQSAYTYKYMHIPSATVSS